MSCYMRFPTMWYVRPAKPQISLRIRAAWSEPVLVAWIFYERLATDWTPSGVSKLFRLIRVYACQNATLLEIKCRGSNVSLMKVEVLQNAPWSRIPWSILQYFWPRLSNDWSFKPSCVFWGVAVLHRFYCIAQCTIFTGKRPVLLPRQLGLHLNMQIPANQQRGPNVAC